MTEWREATLSELIELIGGGTPKTKIPEYWNGDIPWLSVVDFNTGKKFVFDTEKKITKAGLNNSSTKILKAGDIIISARGTVGVIAVLGKEMAFNQSCYGVRANNEATNEYVYYLLKDTVSNFLQIAHGGVFDTITRDTFKEIDISLPPLPEQKSIAEVLSSLDDKIDLLHRQNKTFEQMAETLFRQWFVVEAREDWEEVTISYFAEHSKSSVKPSAKENVVYAHYSIPGFDAGKEPVFENGKEIRSNKYQVSQNSILFSKLNPHKDKRVWLTLDIIPENAICSTEFQVIKPYEESCLYFIYGWLTNPENYREIASGVGGTSGSHQRISPGEIFSFPIPKVSLEVLNSYSENVKPIFRKQQINQQQIRTLENLRDTLLPKLMSGEIRIASNG